MELTIAANRSRDANTAVATPYKAKYEPKKPTEASKIEKKDARAITSRSTKFSFKTKITEGGLNLGDSKRLTLKGMQAKEYPFFESDIPEIFEELLKAKLIELPEIKRPKEANQSTDRDYYKYHRPTERLEAPKTTQPSLPGKEEEVVEQLKRLMLPLTQPENVASTILKDFVTPVQGPKIQHGTMYPKDYDLLVKAELNSRTWTYLETTIAHSRQKSGWSTRIHKHQDTLRGAKALSRKRKFSKVGSSTVVYPTELKRRDKKAKQLKAWGHKQSTPSYKKTPIKRWRVVQTPQAVKGETDFSLHITIDEGELSPEDAIDAPLGLEEQVKTTVDELKEVNLGTTEDPRPTYIIVLLTPAEEAEYIALLTEFRDMFAWTYTKILGLDPKVAVNHLAVKKGARPVK
ncbi:hypothetical protein LIER_00789 [Lithospermum erythrorhizon]|uniref:Uncharacterized protein n=1 Tax=Lithospermum erythrorhizon TaxID=34254 RepID=A0AAV3NL30_LITER